METAKQDASNLNAESAESAEKEKGFRFSPGGTSGGLGTFLFGFVLAVAGGYLIMNQVQVTSGYWSWFGTNTFGLTLIPLVIGLGLLFLTADLLRDGFWPASASSLSSSEFWSTYRSISATPAFSTWW